MQQTLLFLHYKSLELIESNVTQRSRQLCFMVLFAAVHQVFSNNNNINKIYKIQDNCYIFRIRSLNKIKEVFFSHTLMLQTDMPQRLAHIKGLKEQIRICIYFKLL